MTIWGMKRLFAAAVNSRTSVCLMVGVMALGLGGCAGANDTKSVADRNTDFKVSEPYDYAADDVAIEKTSHESNSRAAKSYYPPSAKLRRFASDNPYCLLWSDWESLCSYTKEGGGMECHDDPTFRVEPSSPFCASIIDLTKTTDDQLKSLNRFCSLVRKIPVLDKAPIRKVDACVRYENERPFSGRRMSVLNHRWCETWLTDKGLISCHSYEDKALSSGESISHTSNTSSYSCNDAISENVSFEKATCSQWAKTDQCQNPQFRGNGVNYAAENQFLDFSDESAYDKIVIAPGSVHIPLPLPTLGVFCGK